MAVRRRSDRHARTDAALQNEGKGQQNAEGDAKHARSVGRFARKHKGAANPNSTRKSRPRAGLFFVSGALAYFAPPLGNAFAIFR